MFVHPMFDERSVRASTDTSTRIVDLVTCSGHESSSLELAGLLDKVRKMPLEDGASSTSSEAALFSALSFCVRGLTQGSRKEMLNEVS